MRSEHRRPALPVTEGTGCHYPTYAPWVQKRWAWGTINRRMVQQDAIERALRQGTRDVGSMDPGGVPRGISLAEVVSPNMTAGCGKIARQRATKATRLRSLRRYAGATGTVAALALAALAVPGTGLIEPVAAAATAGAGTSTAVQEVKVPAADLESVGIPGGLSGPVLLHHQPALTAGGKVEVAYVGGGWCPFCALGNWPLQVALSQFGTFTQLGGPQSSSPTDVYPGLKSWSFTGARYVSKYFKLDAFESAQSSSQPYPPEPERAREEVRPCPLYDRQQEGSPSPTLATTSWSSALPPALHLS